MEVTFIAPIFCIGGFLLFLEIHGRRLHIHCPHLLYSGHSPRLCLYLELDDGFDSPLALRRLQDVGSHQPGGSARYTSTDYDRDGESHTGVLHLELRIHSSNHPCRVIRLINASHSIRLWLRGRRLLMRN